MDYTKKFVVYNKLEILKLESRIEELQRENERLKELNEKCRELEFENIRLKNQLNPKMSFDDNNSMIISSNGSDQTMTLNFLQNQEMPETIEAFKANLRPTLTPTNDSHQRFQNNDFLNHGINTNITDSCDDSTNSGIGWMRRESNFNVKNENADHSQEKPNIGQCQKQNRILGTHWSFPILNNRNGLIDLSKELRNKCDKKILFQIIVKEWHKKPENMSRMEFFYHLLAIFIENGVLITFCSEHNPPCRPKVDSKILERNADVLKNFINSVNVCKLIVIEVELLVALENLAYTHPKYRCALGDIMDILFRKGVVEAVAFGEWSQMDSSRAEDKTQLIREIKASGFNLLKRSTSL